MRLHIQNQPRRRDERECILVTVRLEVLKDTDLCGDKIGICGLDTCQEYLDLPILCHVLILVVDFCHHIVGVLLQLHHKSLEREVPLVLIVSANERSRFACSTRLLRSAIS